METLFSIVPTLKLKHALSHVLPDRFIQAQLSAQQDAIATQEALIEQQRAEMQVQS